MTDQGEMSIEQLARALSINEESVISCVDRLRKAMLVDASNDDLSRLNTSLRPTENGAAIANRVISGL